MASKIPSTFEPTWLCELDWNCFDGVTIYVAPWEVAHTHIWILVPSPMVQRLLESGCCCWEDLVKKEGEIQIIGEVSSLCYLCNWKLRCFILDSFTFLSEVGHYLPMVTSYSTACNFFQMISVDIQCGNAGSVIVRWNLLIVVTWGQVLLAWLKRWLCGIQITPPKWSYEFLAWLPLL